MNRTKRNRDFHKARQAKKDEFYTSLHDIEMELKHYKDHFKGKVVYCNCDDPQSSNFFLYFSVNFKELGLRKLITACYRSQDASGDFRSDESIKLLQQADIVVTNPPFSLLREYVAQLIEYEKQFLILGNMNAATYTDIFPLFQNDKMWYGPSIRSGDREFRVPDDYPITAAGSRVDEFGNKYIRVKGVRWFTNLDYPNRHEHLDLQKAYCPDAYPKYANYDAIEVGKTMDIPYDYAGPMGVPITFLDKYNPGEFKILGSSRTLGRPMSHIASKGAYQQGGPRFYLPNGDGTYRRMYERIVIISSAHIGGR